MSKLGLFLIALSLSGCGLPPGLFQGDGRFSAKDVPHALDHMPFPLMDGDKEASASDPVNVLVVGDADQVKGLFLKAGWVVADPMNLKTAAHFAEAFVLRRPYPSAPVSTQYLFDRPQDMAFEKNCLRVNSRDHFRMWKTDRTDKDQHPIWCLACTRDARIGFLPGHLLPDHVLDPDADAERDLVVRDLESTQQTEVTYTLRGLGAGFHATNPSGNQFYTTDGLVKVVELKH